MKIISPSTPTGNTIFCDDIRFEAGGKVTLVGVYAGDMIFPADFPVTIPRLGMRISYSERPNESTEPVEIRIYLPGDSEESPWYRVSLPREQMQAVQSLLADSDAENLITTLFHINSPVLTIKQEGRIRVRAYRGDTEIRIGSLRILKMIQPGAAVAAEERML